MVFAKKAIEQRNLYDYMRPRLMFNTINTKSTDFVYSNKHQKDREARIISVFGMGWELIEKKDCLIRLIEGQEPAEAQIKIDDKEYGIQIAMCIESGRRIGHEYKTKSVYETDRPISLHMLHKTIQGVIKNKIKKYGSGKGINLLLYVNMNHTGVNPTELTNTLSSIDDLDFESIWVIFDTYKPIDNDYAMAGFAIAKLYPGGCKGFFTFLKEGTI